MSYALVHSGFLTPAFVALVFALACTRARGGLARLLTSPPITALGRASYAMYIVHVPLLLVFARFDACVWSDAAPLAAYLGLLCAPSLAAHRYVEEPLRRRLTRGRSDASGSPQAAHQVEADPRRRRRRVRPKRVLLFVAIVGSTFRLSRFWSGCGRALGAGGGCRVGHDRAGARCGGQVRTSRLDVPAT